MNFLITGEAGSVGRDLTASLLEKGHSVRVLDKHAEAFGSVHDGNLELIPGRLEDLRLVQEALRGVDTVILRFHSLGAVKGRIGEVLGLAGSAVKTGQLLGI